MKGDRFKKTKREMKKKHWRDVNSIPPHRIVKVLTVTGIICDARLNGPTRWIKRPDTQVPFRRVHCFRLDGKTRGDVMAVAWRP